MSSPLPLPGDEHLSAWGRFMRGLTPHGVLLLLSLGAGLVVVYALYEARAEWVPLLWKSAPVQAGALLAFSALAVGLAMQSLHRRLSAKLDRTESQLREQSEREMNLLRQQMHDCDSERDELRIEIASVKASTSARIEVMQREIDALRRATGG